jgi:hypothetical protein
MKLIRIFSRLDNIASSIGQKQGLKLILRAMERYPFCMQLQINCSACLANLASVEQNRTLMLEDGCIRRVLENFDRFMDAPQVLAEVCATLANLACHETNSKYIVANGGISLILKAMRTHLRTIDFQVQAFHAMASLGKAGKDIMDRENFMGVLLRSMEIHQADVDLVSAAWHALGSLANSGVTLVHYKVQIIGMIFTSMKRFQTNHTFQITACFALAHVFFNHREAFIDDHAVSSNNGIECLLDTMKRFPNQESLQTTALFALGSIVMKSALHRDTVVNNAGIEQILQAMSTDYKRGAAEGAHISAGGAVDIEAHADPVNLPEPVLYSTGNTRVQCSKPLLLQLFGSVALLNLAEGSEVCREKIIDLGGIHYIFNATVKVADQSDLWFIVYYVS